MLARNFKVSSLILAGLLSSLSVAQSTCVRPQPVTDPKFVPGQVWSYQTRPGEDNSKITILRVDQTPKLGTVVHVRIDHVHFGNCKGGPSPELLQHVPFTRAALEASVTAKIDTVSKLPDYAAGYQDWLSHCGGAYTLTAERVIAIDDDSFNSGLGCR